MTIYRGAFREELAKLGWREGRDLRIELRFGSGDPALIRGYAAELVDLAPDIIVTSTGATTDAVRQQTQTIPILFVGGGDPVAASSALVVVLIVALDWPFRGEVSVSADAYRDVQRSWHSSDSGKSALQ